MKEYELQVGDQYYDAENVYGTSLVERPATHKLFAVFSSEGEESTKDEDNKGGEHKTDAVHHKFQVLPTRQNSQMVNPTENGFERIISGVWFMPDTDYPRTIKDENGVDQLITVSMDKDQLMLTLKNFMQRGGYNNFDVQHNGQPVYGLRTIETWMLYDYSQLSPVLLNSIEDLGYTADDIPIGTVFMSVFIDDEDFFNDMILSGMVKGFSIDGFFDILEKENTTEMDVLPRTSQMFKALGLDQTEGTLITTEGSLSIKEEILFNDVKVVDGSYKLSNKFSVEVRGGKVVDFGFEEVAAVIEVPAVVETVIEATAIVDTPDATIVDVVETNEVIVVIEDKVDEVIDDSTATDASSEEVIADNSTKDETNDNFGLEGTDKENKEETNPPTSDVNITDTANAELLTSKDTEIAELKAQLKAETEAKEKALKSKPITNGTETNKTYDKSLYREKVVGGKIHYILK